jgi:hypothetical protein
MGKRIVLLPGLPSQHWVCQLPNNKGFLSDEGNGAM